MTISWGRPANSVSTTALPPAVTLYSHLHGGAGIADSGALPLAGQGFQAVQSGLGGGSVGAGGWHGDKAGEEKDNSLCYSKFSHNDPPNIT